MKKIFSLNLSNLINSKHFNFMEFMVKTLTLYAIIGEKFADAVAAFKAAFSFENQVYMKYDRKHLTSLINDAENERDRQFRIMRDATKTAQMMPNETIRAAADEVMGVIDLYGGAKIPGMAMDAESGILTNLIEDLETKYQAQITVLNISDLVAALKTTNEQFKELLRQRTQTDSEIGKAAMEEARKASDATYRVLVSCINNEYFLKKDPALVPVIDYMNVEIDRYRIGLGQGVGNPEWGADDELPAEGDTETPPAGDAGNNGGSGSGTPGSGSGEGIPIEPGPGGDDPDL